MINYCCIIYYKLFSLFKKLVHRFVKKILSSIKIEIIFRKKKKEKLYCLIKN